MNHATQSQPTQEDAQRLYIASRLRRHLAPLVENHILNLDENTYSGWSYDGYTEVTITDSEIRFVTSMSDIVSLDETHDLLAESFWYYNYDELNTLLTSSKTLLKSIDPLCQWQAIKIRRAIFGDS